MALKRIRPVWLLFSGVLLLGVAPLSAFALLQFVLSSGLSNTAAQVVFTTVIAAVVLVGLGLLVLGAHRVRLSVKTLIALIGASLSLLACHYLAWRNGIVRDFGGAAAIWLLLLIPLAVIGLVTLIRSVATRERALWTGTGFALWAAQAGTICYLYWIVGGV